MNTAYPLIVQTLMLRDVTDCCHRNKVMNRLATPDLILQCYFAINYMKENFVRTEQRHRLGGWY